MIGEKILSNKSALLDIKAVAGIIYSLEATCDQPADVYTIVDVYIKVPRPANVFTT